MCVCIYKYIYITGVPLQNILQWWSSYHMKVALRFIIYYIIIYIKDELFCSSLILKQPQIWYVGPPNIL